MNVFIKDELQLVDGLGMKRVRVNGSSSVPGETGVYFSFVWFCVWTLTNDAFVFAEEFVGGQRCGPLAAGTLHLCGVWLR